MRDEGIRDPFLAGLGLLGRVIARGRHLCAKDEVKVGQAKSAFVYLPAVYALDTFDHLQTLATARQPRVGLGAHLANVHRTTRPPFLIKYSVQFVDDFEFRRELHKR